MFLLDTNVVSEFRKIGTGRGNARVLEWANDFDHQTGWLSVMTVFEIELGIAKLKRRDPVQAEMLSTWYNGTIVPAYEGRILSVTDKIAHAAAWLHVPDPRPFRDSFIAATAIVHGLTIVTRNEADFRNLPVPVFNPFA